MQGTRGKFIRSRRRRNNRQKNTTANNMKKKPTQEQQPNNSSSSNSRDAWKWRPLQRPQSTDWQFRSVHLESWCGCHKLEGCLRISPWRPEDQESFHQADRIARFLLWRPTWHSIGSSRKTNAATSCKCGKQRYKYKLPVHTQNNAEKRILEKKHLSMINFLSVKLHWQP